MFAVTSTIEFSMCGWVDVYVCVLYVYVLYVYVLYVYVLYVYVLYVYVIRFAKTRHNDAFLEFQIFASVSFMYLKLCSVAISMLYC